MDFGKYLGLEIGRTPSLHGPNYRDVTRDEYSTQVGTQTVGPLKDFLLVINTK